MRLCEINTFHDPKVATFNNKLFTIKTKNINSRQCARERHFPLDLESKNQSDLISNMSSNL